MEDNYLLNSLREMPPDRRTVLVAIHWENEAHKQGILEHARRQSWQLLDLRYYNMKVPRTVRPDGVLFHLANEEAPLARRLLHMGVPAVQIQDYHMPRKCCCVVHDRRAVGRIAAEHFAARNFKNVAYLRSEKYDHSPVKRIGQSFVHHARRLGAKADTFAIQRPGGIIPWDRFDALVERFREEISRFELPLGIFTYSDIMAGRICHLCDAIGLSVPEQVAVLGAGNDPVRCECSSVPLSSVELNSFAQGRAAAELLDRLMDGQRPPGRQILIEPAGVVTRKSTDILALPDLETARALRYMWEHLHENLRVPAIAAAVGLSRRKLERHFRQHLKRGVNEELNRRRIELCCHQLAHTKLSIEAISTQAGFHTAKYFYKVFGEAVGMTPRTYRLTQQARLHGGETPAALNRRPPGRPRRNPPPPGNRRKTSQPVG